MLHAMPWYLRSMFSSKQQEENSHIVMIKIINVLHININIPFFGAQSYSPGLTVPTMSLYILLIFL